MVFLSFCSNEITRYLHCCGIVGARGVQIHTVDLMYLSKDFIRKLRVSVGAGTPPTLTHTDAILTCDPPASCLLSGTSAGWISPTFLPCPTRVSLRSWWRRCCPTVRFWGLTGHRASRWGQRSSPRMQPAAPSPPSLHPSLSSWVLARLC